MFVVTMLAFGLMVFPVGQCALSYTHPNPLSVPVGGGVRLFPKSRRVRLSQVDIATEAVVVTHRLKLFNKTKILSNHNSPLF